MEGDKMDPNSRRRTGWFIFCSDFGNMMKAFIGANFLNVAYAFYQSGLGLGILGLVIIASLTDHCCLLIMKCKYYAIRKVLKDRSSVSENDDEDRNREEYSKLVKQLENNLSYGDVGKLSFGKVGLTLVNICIVLTQFGFCVSYFVFVGQTLKNLFPLRECQYNISGFSDYSGNISHLPLCHNLSALYLDEFQRNSTFLLNSNDVQFEKSLSNSNITSFYSDATSSLTLNSDTSDSLSLSDTNGVTPKYHNQTGVKYESTAPDVKLLVLCPLPIFLLFVLIRHLRHLGIISIFADICLFIGCVSVFSYLIADFEVHKCFKWFNFQGFPVFFGQVTGSFEGIGVILPVEASMEGNRENFPLYLHGAISILAAILCTMGTLGYLRFGNGVQQMINSNIPISNPIAYAVNICLIIAIILTFPLQIFPVIELIEKALMSEGKLCGPKVNRLSTLAGEDSGTFHSETETLITSTSDNEEEEGEASIGIAHTVHTSVPAWKRNILRAFIACLAAALAVIFRDNFAYIGSFVGAVGSTMLAYILPSAFHLKLASESISLPIKIKDVCIIIFGVVAGITSLYAVIDHLVEHTTL